MESGNDKKNINQAIAEAIAFFDMFDYPLTAWELWLYSKVKCNLSDIREALASQALVNALEEKNGFYFLPGRSNIISARAARYNYTDRKFKRALLIAKLFKFIPWIKMIAIGNIIGANNLKDNSDIDFFIITEDKRVWLTRLFCTAIIKMLRIRPAPGNVQDKICLSFYISAGAMDLQGIMLTSSNAGKGKEAESVARGLASSGEDIYFIYWLAGLMPIFMADGIYAKFIKANNWIFDFLPNWRPAMITDKRNAGREFSRWYRDIADLFLGGLEKNARQFQLKILPPEIKNLINKDSGVIVNDQVLKFHVNDRRKEYSDMLKEKLVAISNF